MTNEITPANPAQARLATFMAKRKTPAPPALPVRFGAESGLPSTYAIARTDGGVGASTLALMLEYFYGRRAFIIQVGGLKSWAYAGRSETDFLHVKPYEDEDHFSPPLDARLRVTDRLAIIEYEHAMPREAIKAAALLSQNFNAHVALCLISGVHDEAFGLPDIARRQEVEPLLFRQPGAAPVRNEDVLKIPTVPRSLMEALRRKPDGFAAIADSWFSPIAGMIFRDNVHAFGHRISERIG